MHCITTAEKKHLDEQEAVSTSASTSTRESGPEPKSHVSLAA